MAVICSCAQENLGSVRRTCTDVRARGTKRRIVLSRRQNETQGISNGGVAFRKIGNPRGDVKHRAQMFRICCVGSGGWETSGNAGNERERRERYANGIRLRQAYGATGFMGPMGLMGPVLHRRPIIDFCGAAIAPRPPHLDSGSLARRNHRSPFDAFSA